MAVNAEEILFTYLNFSIMKKKDDIKTIKVLHDNEILEDLSLDDIKGGATGANICCLSNSACNNNEGKTQDSGGKE